MFKKDSSTLLPLIKELQSYIPLKDKRNDAISKSDVAWQIDHTLKVVNKVIDGVLNSNPEDYKWRFNNWRAVLFTFSYIPRGKAKAPKIVRPPEIITTQELETQVNLAYKNVELLKSLNKNAHFTHFIFGQLNKGQTIKFLKMHTTHHLKIIRDILK